MIGTTFSSDFPTTGNAIDSTHNGREDAFVAGLALGSGGGNTYEISGRVTHVDGIPVAGVAVSDNAGHTAMTDANGNYTITDLPAGSYTLIGGKDGYFISHQKLVDDIWVNSRELDVNVSQDVAEQDFIAIACQGSTGVDICQLQKGDILLENAHGADTSKFAGFVGTYWFHSALYDGEGNVVEAAGQMRSDDKRPEVRTSPIHTHDFYDGADDMVVLRLKQEHQSKIGGALTWAKRKATDPEVVFLPLWKWLNPLNKTQDREFYCSLFVWRSFYEQGLDLDSTPGLIVLPGLEDQVSPDDLFANSMPGSGSATVVFNMSSILPEGVVVLTSPADLTVIDADQHVTGIDPETGLVVNNIPGSYYSGPASEPEWIALRDISGLLDIQVRGTGNGDYTLGVQILGNDSTSNDVFAGETYQGKVDLFRLSDPTLGPIVIHGVHAGQMRYLPSISR